MSEQKTEKPTQRRVQKAREEGNFASSRHFIAGTQFLVFVTLLRNYGDKLTAHMGVLMASLLKRAFGPDMTSNDWLVLLRDISFQVAIPILGAGLGLAALSVALQLGLTQMGFSFKKLTPDLNRLNPAGKVKQVFQNAVPSLLQAVILLPIAAYLVYAIAYEHMDQIMMLPLKPLDGAKDDVTSSLGTLLWRAACVFFVFGCVDLFREKNKLSSQLKMTKQEVKEEHKQSEGDPHTKARIRRIQREQAKKRMMAAVPKATAVVVNPTHFSVALRYDPDTMVAPLVVAKGQDYMALQIRKIATENQVPLIENPPLARGLYAAVEVGQEIPPHLYKAVAEILAYIFKLMHRR